MNETLAYVGAAVIAAWGVAHIISTAAVVRGFGTLSPDNRNIIIMEWVAEGLTLCFIGVLVTLVTLAGETGSAVVSVAYRACAGLLIVMAVWALATGARTKIVPIKICPVIKTGVAILFISASM